MGVGRHESPSEPLVLVVDLLYRSPAQRPLWRLHGSRVCWALITVPGGAGDCIHVERTDGKFHAIAHEGSSATWGKCMCFAAGVRERARERTASASQMWT
eukprot:6418654-Prymnesium_polylepis.1